MGAASEPVSAWGEWRRHLRSGPEVQLVRTWFRRVDCPTCIAATGRACRTSNGHPTTHHRARRDAAGDPPYEQWKEQGLWALPQPPASTVLKEADKARIDYKVDVALGDAVAVIRIVLANQLGLTLHDEATFDRIDNAVRHLLAVRGPVGSADLVTILVGLIVQLLATTAGPDGDPEAQFDALMRSLLAETRRQSALDMHRPRD
ncbi:hypothetical protein [Streptomyces ramulosus]|uniref:zinc finger domain-containing protein n=1 Tax=Streptomyces TaxID=1883 RepID=UPI0031EF16DD